MNNVVEPMQVAEWFIKNNLDNPSNTVKGNMKLQKLLFFSQLIYMCENNGETMYQERFSAFDNGMVLEPVRKEYLNNYFTMKKNAQENIELPSNVEETLKVTVDIFGKCTADELSDLSHQFEAWSKYLKMSIEGNNFHNKEKAIVPYEELEKELDKIEKVLKAYKKRSLSNGEADY